MSKITQNLRICTHAGMIEAIRKELVDNLNIPVRGISIHRDGGLFSLKFRVHILLPWHWILFSFIFGTKKYVKNAAMKIVEEGKPVATEGRVTVGLFKPRSS